MKKAFIFTLFLFSLLYSYDLDTYIQSKEVNVDKITSLELKNKIFNKDMFHLIDVRLPNERKVFGTIESDNSIHIPRGMIEFKIQENIKNKNDEIIVFCQKGPRGLLVSNTLMELGYKNVKNLNGGFENWEETCGDTSKFNNIWFKKPKIKSSCSH